MESGARCGGVQFDGVAGVEGEVGRVGGGVCGCGAWDGGVDSVGVRGDKEGGGELRWRWAWSCVRVLGVLDGLANEMLRSLNDRAGVPLPHGTFNLT